MLSGINILAQMDCGMAVIGANAGVKLKIAPTNGATQPGSRNSGNAKPTTTASLKMSLLGNVHPLNFLDGSRPRLRRAVVAITSPNTVA